MWQEPSAYYNVQGSKKWKHCEILANNKKITQIGNHFYFHKWKQQKLKTFILKSNGIYFIWNFF
jgi:hypothetical protein